MMLCRAYARIAGGIARCAIQVRILRDARVPYIVIKIT